jgi:hypothetical protein
MSPAAERENLQEGTMAEVQAQVFSGMVTDVDHVLESDQRIEFKLDKNERVFFLSDLFADISPGKEAYVVSRDDEAGNAIVVGMITAQPGETISFGERSELLQRLGISLH